MVQMLMFLALMMQQENIPVMLLTLVPALMKTATQMTQQVYQSVKLEKTEALTHQFPQVALMTAVELLSPVLMEH